jgi:hypothetical protein
MTRTPMTWALLATLSTGCAGYAGLYTEEGCLETVKIKHPWGKIKAKPKDGEVCRGTTITVRPAGPNRRTATVPKRGNPEWLRGESDGDDFELFVPEDEMLNNVVEYSVEVEGLKTLDPTFRIIR